MHKTSLLYLLLHLTAFVQTTQFDYYRFGTYAEIVINCGIFYNSMLRCL